MGTRMKQRLIIGISGASGTVYGIKLLEVLRDIPGVETHLVMTKAAHLTRAAETNYSAQDLAELADVSYSIHDVGAAIASGSYSTMGMIIAPCSMRSLGEIAHGLSSNLLTRAADVVLKEKRRLVLMARETPLHAIHLQNMLTISELGGIIAPPVPAFYNQPKTLDDIVLHSIGRVLDLFDLPAPFMRRWGIN